MRNKTEAWKELSQLFHRYSGIGDPRGDAEFARMVGISVATVVFLRTPGVGPIPDKDEVLKAISHIREAMRIGMQHHALDLVNEAYKPARRENSRLGLGSPMYYRSRDPIL